MVLNASWGVARETSEKGWVAGAADKESAASTWPDAASTVLYLPHCWFAQNSSQYIPKTSEVSRLKSYFLFSVTKYFIADLSTYGGELEFVACCPIFAN